MSENGERCYDYARIIMKANLNFNEEIIFHIRNDKLNHILARIEMFI